MGATRGTSTCMLANYERLVKTLDNIAGVDAEKVIKKCTADAKSRAGGWVSAAVRQVYNISPSDMKSALEGKGRGKAFFYGAMSGIVEPVAGGITVLLAAYITPVLPYLLAFAAGAMIYVVVEELVPESAEGEHSNIGTIGFAAGFVLMMILDVALA